MTQELKKFFGLIFLVAIVLASFSFGFYFGKSQCKICPPEKIDLSLFWEAYHKLEEKFVDKEKLDFQKLLYGAISGMAKSLEDPYTIFLTPEESKRFEEDVKGIFEGVGMEIGIRKGQLQVVAPLEGTPAQRAGLKAGDKILKIDDQETSDLTVEEAVNLIRGPKGTEVRLLIFREDWEKPKEIVLKREVIVIPSLKWEIKEIDGQKIIYLRLYQFFEKTDNDLKKEAIEIVKIPTKKMILDLRNNPGGYLEMAQKITGWFLEKGEIVVIEDFGNGKRKEHKSLGPSIFSNYKIVILINEGSASASEILAGALRDNRGVLLIGEKTFGKGSVQELIKLSDNSSLKITIAKWLTPKGSLISDAGLTPDIKVEITEEDIKEGKDPQLEKAIEILKNL